MYVGELTDDGLYRLELPPDHPRIVKYDRLAPGPGKCVDNIYFDGKRLGSTLSYVDDGSGEPHMGKGIILVTAG